MNRRIACLVFLLLFSALAARADERPGAASALMARCEAVLYAEKLRLGLVNEALDPEKTGLIGVEFSPLTTSLGRLSDKRASSRPAMADVVAAYLRRAGVKRGDWIAVNASGSTTLRRLAASLLPSVAPARLPVRSVSVMITRLTPMAMLIAIATGIITSVIVLFVWVPPTPAQWGLFVLLSFIANGGHYLIVKSYDHAEASLLAPLAYTEMVMAVLAGWYFFGDFPDLWTFVGVAILIACAIYISWRERVRSVPPIKDFAQP